MTLRNIVGRVDKNTFDYTLEHIREHVQSNQGMVWLSREVDIDRSLLYKNLQKGRRPKIDLLASVLDTLGLELIIKPKDACANRSDGLKDTYTARPRGPKEKVQ